MATTYDGDQGDVSRRDFIYIATTAFAAIGAAAALWPAIDQMNPDASALSLASTEVDLAPVARRAGHHRSLARQADLHPPPHAGRDQEGAGRAGFGPERPLCRGCSALPRTFPRATRTERSPARSNGSSRSAFAPISAAFRRDRRPATTGAFMAAGSARAMARCTTLRDASARAPRRVILKYRPIEFTADTKIKIG